jgi:hypothetical protein
VGIGALSPWVKRPGLEPDNLLTSSLEAKNAWSYIPAPPNVFMAWYVVKHRENLKFTLRITLLIVNPDRIF